MSKNEMDSTQDSKASNLVQHLFGYKHAEDMILIAKELAAALERIDQLEVDLVSDSGGIEGAALSSLARLEDCMASIKKLDQQSITAEISNLSERVSAIGARMESARRELADSMVSRQELSATKDVSAERIVELRRDFDSSLQSLKHELAATAKEFSEPKSLAPAGEWKMGETYARLAVVTLNGSSYLSTADGNSDKPSAKSKKWQVLARRGASGAYNGTGDLDTHIADNAAHGATSANTASRIVTRNAGGTFTISGIQLDTAAAPTSATGLIRWNDVDKTAEIVTEGGVVLQLGQEETVYVRNNSGVALVEGDAVYITGSTGQRTTVAKVQANSSLAQKTIGLVTTTGGIADNGFGFVTLAGLVRDINTNAYPEGTELWLSPTTAGALTATVPTGDTQRVVRIGYVVRSHATQGMIMVATHYHGTVLSNALMEAEGAAAGRTVLGVVAATESVSGIVELATLAEVATGTDTARAVTPAGMRSAFLSLLPDGYIQSDGATSNRAAGIYGTFDAVNIPRGWIAGAAILTIPFIMRVPTSNPTTNSYLWVAASSATAEPFTLANGMTYVQLQSNTATLRIIKDAGLGSGNGAAFDFTAFRTTYSGQTIFGKITFTQGSTNPVVEVNGVNISASFSLSTSGTPPAWLDAAMVPTYHTVGYNWPAGPAPIVTPILGATSAADDAFYMATGKWPAWVVAGGSCFNVTAGAFVARRVYLITAVGTTDFTLIGAASNTVGVQFTATGVGSGTGTAQQAGALSLPSYQPINVIDDVSGIGGNQGRLLGCTAVTDKHSTRILGRINAASATNQQIRGGALLPVPLNHGIEFVDVECDGSVTLSLGDGTTATRYTASTALTAGRTRIALTTPFAADAAKTGLYVNVTSTGGTYAQFSILGHLLR